MHCKDSQWSLPYFEFPELSVEGTLVPRVCDEFRSWLGIMNDDVYFTGSVELVGTGFTKSREDPEKDGRTQLEVVEAHGIEPHEIDLPEGAHWKDASFMPSAFPNRDDSTVRFIVGRLEACLDDSREFLESLSDERYRPGWFERASRFVVELTACQGEIIEDRVFQRHVTPTSTILQLNSSKGCFFLKSPTTGCNETRTTAIVAELFPDVCPDIVGISEELKCFVSREFDDETPVDTRDAVITLGKLQLDSINHIGCLKEAGCPMHNLREIAKVANKWPEDLRKFELNSDPLTSLLPVIEELCEEAKEFRIPVTLVHGDFATSNVAYAERDGRRNLVIHDWEYAHIGHPFCDFHRIHKHVPETVLEEYLRLWSDFENIERARQAYDLVRDLGWIIKAYTLLDWAKRGNAQLWSDLAKTAWNFLAKGEHRLCP